MDANSPAEGKLDCSSCDDAVKNFVIQEKGEDIGNDIHPLPVLHDIEDEDEVESEDEEWQPHVRWICLNCTMPNPEDEDHCWKCNEQCDSNILEQKLASVPSELTGIDGAAKSTAAEELSFAERISKNLTFSGTFVSGNEKKTAIGFDERMLLHEETGKSHPERPNRLRAIMEGLQASGLLSERCFTIPSREATEAELEVVHTANHISAVQATERQGLSYFTSDTYANEHSALAARLAAGICADLASAIMTGTACNGFAVVRPPGHHAEQDQVMGFCLHNNVCVAARAAQASGAKKVLVVDWDVHHGNGTQNIFEQDPTILYISLHRHEAGAFYPGTGWAHHVGSGAGEGFSVNIPWSCGGIGDEDYLSAFQHIIMPIARQFEPDITIVSAGFDAASGDPLGGCDVTPEGYAQMTSLLSSLAAGRILVVLEGGYNLRSISASAAAVMKVLQGSNPGPLPDNLQPTPAGVGAMLDVFTIQRRYWSNLHDATFFKLETLLDTWSKAVEGKGIKRRYIDNPVWWKWDRKRFCADVP